MADLLCQPADVAEMLGIDPGYQGAELTQVVRLCVQVSGLIRSRRPEIDTWLAAGTVDQDVVTGVAARVVARVKTALALGGVVGQTEVRPQDTVAVLASALVLTPDELALLSPVSVSGEDRGAFTIRPAGTPVVRCW